MKSIWDERYKQSEYAYGKEPNAFLKQQLCGMDPGSILFPAEGEGRNAVYAAEKGWDVYAFDQSEEGRKKALQLAEQRQVHIQYNTDDWDKLPYKMEQFDAIALIYAHFPADIKSKVHHHILRFLKPEGILIFEAFSKKHLAMVQANPAVGGPKEEAMLFSAEELRQDFSALEIVYLKEETITLSEGIYHNGEGSVMRFVGKKKATP